MAQELLLAGERCEHLLGIAPQRGERVAQPHPHVRRSIGKPPEPGIGVHAVVRLLAPHLGRQLRERHPAAAREGSKAHGVGRLVQPSSRNAECPVASSVVEQRGVAVCADVAPEGDLVRVVAGQGREQLIQRAGMPDLILGDRAGRHVLLEHRRDAGPFGIPEADDELVVGNAQQQLSERVAARDVQLLLGRWRGGRTICHLGAPGVRRAKSATRSAMYLGAA